MVVAAASAFVANAAVVAAASAFNNKPGTVGAVAVPARSPANWILPVAVVVASGVAPNTVASTYVLTAFCVGNNVVLEPNAAFDLFEASSFNPNAVVVAAASAFVANAAVVAAASAFVPTAVFVASNAV